MRDMIEKLAERVNGDAHLVWRGRFLDVEFLVEVGDTPFHIRIERGRVAEIVEGPQLMRQWTFAIRASAEGVRKSDRTQQSVATSASRHRAIRRDAAAPSRSWIG